jgi:hypothetical protein
VRSREQKEAGAGGNHQVEGGRMRTHPKHKLANAAKLLAKAPRSALKTLAALGNLVGPEGLEPPTKAL